MNTAGDFTSVELERDLEDHPRWVPLRTVCGMGDDASLEVRAGDREYRVTDHGKTKYQGPSPSMAIAVYNGVLGITSKRSKR